MRHSSRHFPEIGQPFLPMHLFFHIPDLCQILEHSDKSRLLPLLMQGGDRHTEYEPAPIRTLALHLESGHAWRHIALGVVGRLVGMPIEDLAPGTTEDLTDRVACHFLRGGIERGDGASGIGREHPAADTSDDVFMKSLEPVESLFFLSE